MNQFFKFRHKYEPSLQMYTQIWTKSSNLVTNMNQLFKFKLKYRPSLQTSTHIWTKSSNLAPDTISSSYFTLNIKPVLKCSILWQRSTKSQISLLKLHENCLVISKIRQIPARQTLPSQVHSHVIQKHKTVQLYYIFHSNRLQFVDQSFKTFRG
jgi:hypothetical protein